MPRQFVVDSRLVPPGILFVFEKSCQIWLVCFTLWYHAPWKRLVSFELCQLRFFVVDPNIWADWFIHFGVLNSPTGFFAFVVGLYQLW